MNDDTLSWLENYFSNLCDGDWEHGVGIHITTLDNPGWSVDINLEDTLLEDVPFAIIDIEQDDDHWIYCRVRDKFFQGRGGKHDLKNILDIFKTWHDTVVSLKRNSEESFKD